MNEPKVIFETQTNNAAIPHWSTYYNNFMPALKDSSKRLKKIRDAIREMKREHGIE